MLINKDIKITCDKVILVPYQQKHVIKYHKWMQSPELQKLTGSLPLTLEEEYQMQQSWQIDEDKLTFIILDKQIFESTCDEISAMIGDTNLFMLPSEDTEVVDSKYLIAEPEIMIAEESARGKGYGYEAMSTMLSYGIKILNINKFVAKIGQDNTASLQMFQKLGFVQTAVSSVFHEVTMELIVDGVNKELFGNVKINNYK